MRRQLSRAFFILTLLPIAGLAADPTDFLLSQTWETPSCRRIVGTGAVTFTSDEGATLAPTTQRLRGTSYTLGLVALDAPDVLLAVQDRTLLRSANAGCRWTNLGTIPSFSDSFPLYLTAAPGERAYAWADHREDLARIDGTQISVLLSPVPVIVGLGADPVNGDIVRLAGGDGSIWESTDGGGRWSLLGTLPKGISSTYRAAFDPADLDHIVFGTVQAGAFVSNDGALTWTQSIGFAPVGSMSNVFQTVISPADGMVVWAMGLNFAEYDAGDPSQGKHIYRSTDGGATFSPVVDNSGNVTLVNGPVMAAHPTDASVLYFIFGTGFANYGTDLFRYDAGTASLTHTHNAYDRVGAIAFSPADPSYMYLGLSQDN